VRASLFRTAAKWAHQHQLPLAIHLAETLEEGELLAHQTGPFVQFLQQLGVWDREGLVTSSEEVLNLCTRVEPVLFAHGNYLDPAALVPSGGTIVYCPRTHARFGHAPHPIRQFLTRGVRVALGTDSLASNPDLDLLAEARYLAHHHRDLPGETILRMATLSGAEALGWDREAGSLAQGKSADLVVVPLSTTCAADPYALLWENTLPAQAVLFKGKWVAVGGKLLPYSAESWALPPVP
jgi:cytosine/adenosine deaminase-related metal-dependent hydrolase